MPRHDRCHLCGERPPRWHYQSHVRACEQCDEWIWRQGDGEPRPPMWDLLRQDKPPAAMRQRVAAESGW